MLSESRPGRGQIIGASIVVLAALVAYLVAIPYGTMQLPANFDVLPAFGSVTGFADLFTAVLLLGQARATKSRAALYLAAVYLFAVLMMVARALALPGVFADGPVMGGAGSSAWLWYAWHAGFALGAGSFAWCAKDDRAPSDGAVAMLAMAVVVTALAATAMAALGFPFLPVIGVDQGWLSARGIGMVVIACNAVALILVVTRLRARNIVALWLAVTMFVAGLDVALGLAGRGPFTLGWYLAWTLSLVSAVTMFAALLFESMRLFALVTRANRHLQQLSLTDELTSLPNRRAFESAFQMEWRRAGREMLPISLLMLDIDQFKTFNDHLGHPAGDRCLRRVAETLAQVIRRPSDMVARLGGEEFAVVLPNTDEAGAAYIGERVRAAVEALRIASPGASRGIVTVSVGVATDYAAGSQARSTDLIDRADGGLYQAKRNGRNFVRVAGLRHLPLDPPDAMVWGAAGIVAQ
jgi:diguanylate cyclase (GGDEF)-like protein